jgi:hypothetical protein
VLEACGCVGHTIMEERYSSAPSPSECFARYGKLLKKPVEEQRSLLAAGVLPDQPGPFRRLCFERLLEIGELYTPAMVMGALRDADPAIVCKALSHLAERNGEVDSHVLIRIASNDDEEVQRALWKYLGKLGDEVVVSHAAKAWEDMSILVRCEALKAFAERLYEAGFDQIAEALHSEDRNRGRGGQVFILGVRFT